MCEFTVCVLCRISKDLWAAANFVVAANSSERCWCVFTMGARRAAEPSSPGTASHPDRRDTSCHFDKFLVTFESRLSEARASPVSSFLFSPEGGRSEPRCALQSNPHKNLHNSLFDVRFHAPVIVVEGSFQLQLSCFSFCCTNCDARSSK